MYVARMHKPDDAHELVVVTILTVREGHLYAAGDLSLVDLELQVPTEAGFIALSDDPAGWLAGLPEEYRTPYLVVDLVDVPDERADELIAGMTQIR